MNPRHVDSRAMPLRALCCFALAATAFAGAPPNVLLIIADDATHSDLPLYGGRNVKTPHIDRLAAGGMQFRHAYLGMSMCVPCRAELYTGLYPVRNGVAWNHSVATPGTRSVVHHLGELGYRAGLAGKVHASPKEVFPFEMVEGFEPNCVALTASHDVAEMKRFILRDPGRPFFLSVALVVPHAPWTAGDPGRFDPARIALPPYLADTKETREDFSRYLAEIEVLDRQVGDVLAALEETGQAGNTIVLFTSEQGAQFPGCKWTNYEEGVHTALLVRWPGRVRPGARTDALVQYADVLPTLVEAAGGDPSAKGFDGTSFLPVLLGRTEEHRRYVYNMHNNVPEGPPYPIRSVRSREFRYLRNLAPDSLYIERHVMGRSEHNHYWPSWLWASADDPHALSVLTRYVRRPAEELYRAGDGDFESRNLADDPRFASVKRELSAALDRWLAEQKDPGAALDTREAWQANRKAAGQAVR
jgi:uncharacterized sulfatase